MKKSNVITTVAFCIVIAALLVFKGITGTNDKGNEERIIGSREMSNEINSGINGEKNSEINKVIKNETNSEIHSEMNSETGSGEEELSQIQHSSENEIHTKQLLFIGDSRTVGLMEYSQLEGADYFCTVGMSVFNIQETLVSVPGAGKVSLEELLENKKYDNICIMLGVNEMGYQFDRILEKYQELIEQIQSREPDSAIFLQANLHVTEKRSKSDEILNNQSINQLNDALAKMANNMGLCFLDANELFDDENGNLSSDKSSDQTHLYAKYYTIWGKWIVEQMVQ